MKTRKLVEERCVPLLTSHFCDNLEAKNISAARQGVFLNKPII